MNVFATSPELGYVVLVLGLFLVPRVLQRFRLPAAITSVGLGALLGIGFHAFHGDPTIQWLGTLGIVSLFLFAGLEVDFDELRRGAKVVAQHVAMQTAVLALASVACSALLHLHDRAAILLALALFTPSTGFIFDSLGTFGLDTEQRFWVKSKAIASEIVALGILFVTVQSSDAQTLVTSSAVLLALVAILPWVFRVFSTRILPHAPRSEFTFLVIVAVICAYLTRRLGVYYLVGAFVVGVTAVRMRRALPGLVSEKVLGAVELFASFFVPFYFLKAGLHLQAEDFSLRALGMGAAFLLVAVPLRVGMVALHRRLVLGDPVKEGARVGLALVPTLVFTMVLADMLVERYDVDRAIYGALMVFALGNTLLPGLLLRARLEVDGTTDDPEGAPDGNGVTPAVSALDLPTSSGGAEVLDEADAGVGEDAARPSTVTPMGGFVRGAQDAVFTSIVGRGASRADLVGARLRSMAAAPGRYWAEVVVSATLGTVGVLLDSIPLVSAAALACPLVTPVSGLALGLASGSPFLVLRTLLRGVMAFVLSVAVAAVVTRLVPFTAAPELFQARAPTLLDLAAAAACALLAVLGELRPGSAPQVIAARAAVGHAVVVPACIAGYAMGTGAWPAFGMTAWALLANVATVVIVSLVAFLAIGMHRVDAQPIETRELEGVDDDHWLPAVLAPLRRMFASRRARVLRVLMPLVLLVLAGIPLRRALDVVAFEVRTREAVAAQVAALPGRVLETRVRVRASLVSVTVLQVGEARAARDAQETLEAGLRRLVRRPLRVEVVAVPDSDALASLADELRAARTDQVDTAETLRELARQTRAHFSAVASSCAPTDVDARITPDGFATLVRCVGVAPTAPSLAELEAALTERARADVKVTVAALSTDAVAFEPTDAASVAVLVARAQGLAELRGVRLCVERPRAVNGRVRPRPASTVDAPAHVDAALAGFEGVDLVDGERFAHRYAAGSCR